MKYSQETLKKQALFLLDLKQKKDPRYMEFCLTLMLKMRINQHQVETMILNYSRGQIK